MISSFVLNSGLFFIPFCPLIGSPAPLSLATELGVSYRLDNANWNIAGPYNTPNILSELTWKELKSVDIHGGARLEGIGRFYGRAFVDYAFILSGKNQDSDYDGDHRTLEYSRSVADASKGYLFDINSALGLPVISFPFFTIAGVLGYSYHEQKLWLYNGFIKICERNPEYVGKKIEGLDSYYKNRWSSPFVGVDFLSRLCGFALLGEWEYHFASFSGRGHWNLRKEYIDCFRDRSRSASGTRSALKAFKTVFGVFEVGFLIEYCTMHGRGGRSEVDVERFEVDSSGQGIRRQITLETAFNQVNWHSFRVGALLGCGF
jgi:hypothetical protein